MAKWCAAHQATYDIVCDESDLQGFLLFKRDRQLATAMLQELRPLLNRQQVYAEQHRVRAGVVLAFSLRALNEADLRRLLVGGAMVGDRLADRLETMFEQPLAAVQTPELPLADRLMAGARALRETQFKSPTRSRKRSQATTQFRSSINRGSGDENTSEGSVQATTVNGQSANRPGIGAHKGTHEGFDRRLQRLLHEYGEPGTGEPGTAGGLSGLGAEQQPGDVFGRFAQALRSLGEQMRIGPIQDLLKQQGIKWKKSEDGQAIIFFVINGETRAPQPIARIGFQTLSKPQDFQQQLLSMVDFAKGQAPGTEQQRYEEAQEAQKQVREIATQFAPPDPNKPQPAQQMAQPMAPAARLQSPTGKPQIKQMPVSKLPAGKYAR